MLIGIDPGHGGKDPGAIGPKGLTEKSVVLDVGLQLDFLLRHKGFRTLMTRHKDEFKALKQRTGYLNQHKADIAVSIHCNASSSRTANYVATYIYRSGGRAQQLADRVQAALVEETGWRDGGVRTANLHMVRETAMPAILVELGFISNYAQEEALRNECFRLKLADALVMGIEDFNG